MKVNEIMTAKLSYCTSDTSLQDVSKMMLDEDCGAIPVIDNKESCLPVGIITDRDIVIRSLANGKNPFEMKASDCMTTEVFSIEQDMDIHKCYHIMIDKQIRRVVVTENGKVKGIVSQADIALNAPNNDTASVVERVSEPVA